MPARLTRGGHRQRWLRLALAWILGVISVATMAAAPSLIEAPEPRVKAVFLYKFGAYVEWPPGTFASDAAPITIGVVEADRLADELTAVVADRRIDGHPVTIRRMHRGDSLAGLNVLFIGNAASGDIATTLATLDGQPTLAVTETDGALGLGSTINFVVADGKVRFDVSLASAEARSLKISSRLLAVARKVTGEP